MHHRVERQLSAYLDRELTPDEEAAVRRHLEECAAAAPVPWFSAWRTRPALALAVATVVVLLLLVPLIRGQIDRLRAAEFGLDLFVREHAITAASDPLVDRAYLGLLVTDANLRIVGARREAVER